MSFIADKQTLDDLNLTGKYKSDSVFNLFNKVRTDGGEKLLEQMFYHPLTDSEEISRRSHIFSHFQNKALELPFSNEELGMMENYLNNSVPGNVFTAAIGNLRKRITASVMRDVQYDALRAGFNTTVAVLNTCDKFVELLGEDSPENPYPDLKILQSFFKDDRLKWIKYENLTALSLFKLTTYDHLLRHTLQRELEQLLQIIYLLDVYIAVGKVAKDGGFCYATAMPKERNLVKIEDMRHPGLKKAVGNPLSFNQESNVVFLTGANMAGKSTFMKTFGISMYLAHMGFPVAAKQMEFSVKDGIYSSINVADNLNMGYSHFYAEVMRVKKVAEEVSSGKDMVVLFDELFKGTNVKDAYDATLAITTAFALYRNCFFIISTHIIEVGEPLRESCGSVQYSYLPTIMAGPVPTYPYKIEAGITTDRQGMIIIENEGILKIFDEAD